jgi:hypothetical protein
MSLIRNLFLGTLLAVACTNPVAITDGVSLRTLSAQYHAGQDAQTTLDNRTAHALVYGQCGALVQRFRKGRWSDVGSTLSGPCRDIGFVLEAQSATILMFHLQPGLSEGTYRFVVTVSPYDAAGTIPVRSNDFQVSRGSS